MSDESLYPQKTIGQILQETRKSEKIVVAQVYRDTKIKEEQLRWMEENRLDNFSDPFYAKSFLEIYADYLGLNSDHILAMYRRDYENRHIKARLKNSKENNKNKEKYNTDIKDKKEEEQSLEINQFRSIFTKRRFFYLLSAIAFLASILGVYSIAQKAFTPPKLFLTSPIELVADYNGKLETSDEFIIFSGATESGSTISINDQPVTLDSEYNFETDQFKVEEDGITVLIKAENSLGAASQIEINVVQKAEQIEEMDIVVTAKSNTQFILKSDDIIRFDDKLEKGKSVKRVAQRKIEIITKNPQNISVSINNSEFSISDGLIFENTGQEIIQRK